ncbi:ORF1 [Yacon necrotic mottle virus]|uniref:ORF1 n=1 Tax=Yacon necrotic mottle virus TaxID=1561150 RepID=A0A0C4MYT8_9VIRU|nr:ORF1 [Yacon necrotic mottle virus]AIT58607.1 ORF1 [Yacon necrotic mottle virus]
MADRFEKSIKDWYDHSQTSNLEFINPLKNQNQSISELENNISCIFDRLSLFAKISIKNFHKIISHLESLEKRLEKCEEIQRKTQSEIRKDLQQISSEIHKSKPLTEKQVLSLVNEIAQQPKLVEEQALRLTEDLNSKVQKVEELLHEVKGLIIG